MTWMEDPPLSPPFRLQPQLLLFSAKEEEEEGCWRMEKMKNCRAFDLPGNQGTKKRRKLFDVAYTGIITYTFFLIFLQVSWEPKRAKNFFLTVIYERKIRACPTFAIFPPEAEKGKKGFLY